MLATYSKNLRQSYAAAQMYVFRHQTLELMKRTLFVFLISFPLIIFAQRAERAPNQKVQCEHQVKSNVDLVINEEHLQITIHPDGSKTIIVKTTEVKPDLFLSSTSDEHRSDMSTIDWNKEDLTLYIDRLKLKKIAVAASPDQHAKLIENGWYEYIDKMIQESEALLKSIE